MSYDAITRNPPEIKSKSTNSLRQRLTPSLLARGTPYRLIQGYAQENWTVPKKCHSRLQIKEKAFNITARNIDNVFLLLPSFVTYVYPAPNDVS